MTMVNALRLLLCLAGHLNSRSGCVMDQDFTLPRLQSMLDDLPDGRRIALARTQVDALFGLNDVGATRLMRFAEGHKCVITHADSSVVFEKRS